MRLLRSPRPLVCPSVSTARWTAGWIAGWIAVVGALMILAGCAGGPKTTAPEPPVPDSSASDSSASDSPATLQLRPTSPSDLPGWSLASSAGASGAGASAVGPALEAFVRSCDVLMERPGDAAMVAGRPAFGTVRDWHPACYRARALTGSAPPTEADARRFFQTFFRPFRVTRGSTPTGGEAEGLFTGYFEPQLRGARDSSARFTEPLRRPPSDLVRVPLGRFRGALDGETLFGRVEGQTLVPYFSRAAIHDGRLAGRDLALAWVDSRVDKFFLQIQGSGRVVLDDGTVMRVGYAAQNGQPYRAIGRDLIAMGAVPREQMSMQAIRDWLAAHPAQADSVMNLNRSYVFFRELDVDASLGPLGAQGVPLTPEHSLAVDPRFVPYGAPLWLVTRRPTDPSPARRTPRRTPERTPERTDGGADTTTVPFRQMMIAQDTGGAIRGAVRGDVFWGAGPRARALAGRMKSRGAYFVWLPRTLSHGRRSTQ